MWIFLFLFASEESSAQHKQPFYRSIESSFWEGIDENGNRIQKTVTGFFESIFTCPTECHTILLEQQIEHIQQVGILGQTSKIHVKAWQQEEHGQYRNLWEITDGFDEGEVWDDFYKTTLRGCCESEDAYRLFDLSDGKLLLQYTSALFQVNVPNSPIKALLAYHSDRSMTAFEGQDRHKQIHGLLILNIREQSTSKVYFRYPPGIESSTPSIDLIVPRQPKGTKGTYEYVLDLWFSEGKTTSNAITDFVVRLRFTDGSFMILPVKDGIFDILSISGNTTVEVFPP